MLQNNQSPIQKKISQRFSTQYVTHIYVTHDAIHQKFLSNQIKQ